MNYEHVFPELKNYKYLRIPYPQFCSFNKISLFCDRMAANPFLPCQDNLVDFLSGLGRYLHLHGTHIDKLVCHFHPSEVDSYHLPRVPCGVQQESVDKRRDTTVADIISHELLLHITRTLASLAPDQCLYYTGQSAHQVYSSTFKADCRLI